MSTHGSNPGKSFFIARPDISLRTEGLLALIVACVAYQQLYPGRWGIFALFFLAPDIAFLAYLRPNSAIAALAYNTLHTYALPLALALFAWWHGSPVIAQGALIWIAHISFDRLAGYGLKFPGEFKRTHIQAAAPHIASTLLRR